MKKQISKFISMLLTLVMLVSMCPISSVAASNAARIIDKDGNEHCFDGDPDCPMIYFDKSEPTGGFDYVKPEPKKQIGLKDLFEF